MQRFIHLSDLHIRWFKDAPENTALSFLVPQIVKRYEAGVKPTVLITGDITDDGTEQQYKEAVRLLKPLQDNGFRLLVVPGNHDYGTAGNVYLEKSLERYEQIILRDFLRLDVPKDGEFYPYVVESDDVVFIGVDSVVANLHSTVHYAAGEVGEPQRKVLRSILDRYTEVIQTKVIVTYFHHHPFDRRRVMQMDDAKEVMNIVSGRTDFLCFGHDHVAESHHDKDRIDWILAAGKTTQPNARGQYTFTEVTIVGKGQNMVSTVSLKR